MPLSIWSRVLTFQNEAGTFYYKHMPSYSAVGGKFKFTYLPEVGALTSKHAFKTKAVWQGGNIELIFQYNRIQQLVTSNITELLKENQVQNAEEVMGAAVKIKKSPMSKVSNKLQGGTDFGKLWWITLHLISN